MNYQDGFLEEVVRPIVPTISMGIAICIVIGLYNVVSSYLEGEVIKLYNDEMDSQGRFEFVFEEDGNHYMTEYITATPTYDAEGNNMYIVPEGYTLTEDQAGRIIGIKHYQVIKLIDGTEMLIQINEEQLVMNEDNIFTKKLG